MIEEQYSVNIYFIVVAFDINLSVTSCSLLAGGVFRCPSGLSCFELNADSGIKFSEVEFDNKYCYQDTLFDPPPPPYE